MSDEMFPGGNVAIAPSDSPDRPSWTPQHTQAAKVHNAHRTGERMHADDCTCDHCTKQLHRYVNDPQAMVENLGLRVRDILAMARNCPPNAVHEVYNLYRISVYVYNRMQDMDWREPYRTQCMLNAGAFDKGSTILMGRMMRLAAGQPTREVRTYGPEVRIRDADASLFDCAECRSIAAEAASTNAVRA